MSVAELWRASSVRPTLVERIIDAAAALRGAREASTPLLMETPVHAFVAEVVHDLATALYNGDYLDTNGQATLVLVGPRCVGKTSTLRALTEVLPVLEEFRDKDKDRLLACHIATDKTTSLGVVAQVAGKLGGDFDGVVSVDALEERLELKKSRLMLFISELDGLYEARETPCGVFNELSALGDVLRGRLVVVLCGSHPFIPSLIKNVYSTAVANKFHALGRVTRDLNGTKFPVEQLPLDVIAHTSPDAAEAAARNIIAGTHKKRTGYSDPMMRGMLFYVGCRVRRLQQLIAYCEGSRVASWVDLGVTGLAAVADERVMALDAAVLQRLRRLNEPILARYGNGGLAVFQQNSTWPAVIGLDLQADVAAADGTSVPLGTPADTASAGLQLEQALAFCPSLLLSFDDTQRVKSVFPCSMSRLLPDHRSVVSASVRSAFTEALGAEG